MLNVMALMENIKSYSNARIASIIENDPELAENTNEDNNNISALIHINLSLKICKLALVILVVSYFVGITFFIYSDMVRAFCGLTGAQLGTDDLEFFLLTKSFLGVSIGDLSDTD